MRDRPKINKAKRQSKERKRQKDPPQIAVPWGRAASAHRPGLFTKQYFEKHGDVCAADVFSALREELKRVNKERVKIGEKPIWPAPQKGVQF